MYSISEMKDVFGFKSHEAAREMCKKLGVPLHLFGNKYLIYLTDIQLYAPQLYASMLECNNIQSIKEENHEYDLSLLKEQFNV